MFYECVRLIVFAVAIKSGRYSQKSLTCTWQTIVAPRSGLQIATFGNETIKFGHLNEILSKIAPFGLAKREFKVKFSLFN